VEHKNSDVRLAAIKKLTDQDLLEKIARNENEEVWNRGVAAGQITDQKRLFQLTMASDCGKFVHLHTVKSLTDPSLLAEVALKHPDDFIRTSATGQIADKAILTRIVAQANDPYVVIRAAQELGDKALLNRMRVWDTPERTRQERDQALLKDIALRARHVDVRIAAVENLTDQAALAKFATEGGYEGIRAAAIPRLTDQAVLAKVAVADRDPLVRRAATRKLADSALRARIAREDKDSPENQAAMAKRLLEDSSVQDPNTRYSALAAINEPHALAMIAFGSTDSDLAWAAYRRLAESRTVAEFVAAARDPISVMHSSVLSKMTHECATIPYDHRARWTRNLFETVVPMVDPVVFEDLGGMQILGVRWEPLSKTYGWYDERGNRVRSNEKYTVHGEAFSVTCRFSKSPEMGGAHWSTSDWPDDPRDEGFYSAQVDAPRLKSMRAMCARLSPAALKRIASGNRDSRFRELAALEIKKRSK